MVNYTVYDHGQTRQGLARVILEQIRIRAAANNVEIAQMNVEQYADALIEDAPYFVEEDLLKALREQRFESKFDQALSYLAQVPTSGIRILKVA